MLDTIKAAYQFLITLPPAFWAIVAGLLISWCGTQAVKFQLSDEMDDLKLRRAVRAIAMVLGALPTYALWPTHDAPAAIWAILVGLASPIAYTMALRVLKHFYPWLDTALSARPVVRYNAAGEAIGVRMDPNDPTDKTKFFDKTDPK